MSVCDEFDAIVITMISTTTIGTASPIQNSGELIAASKPLLRFGPKSCWDTTGWAPLEVGSNAKSSSRSATPWVAESPLPDFALGAGVFRTPDFEPGLLPEAEGALLPEVPDLD